MCIYALYYIPTLTHTHLLNVYNLTRIQIMAPALNKRQANAATALKQDIIHRLFKEIDVDGNDIVDKVEFRNLLTMLQLHYRYDTTIIRSFSSCISIILMYTIICYSDKRFQRLFKAVDIKAKGRIGIAELETLLFPPDEDAENRRLQQRRAGSQPKETRD